MAHDLNWELRLGFLVHDVSRLRRSIVDRVLKPLGVTRSQWWVLAFLSRADGMSQVALAEELDLGKVALGGLIDRLEKTGLVSRRPDDDDRRVKRVFLTKRAEANSLAIAIDLHAYRIAGQRRSDEPRGHRAEPLRRCSRRQTLQDSAA